MANAFPLTRSALKIRSGRPLKIVCYGDSICEVGRSADWHGGATSADRNWGQVLAGLLRAKFPAVPIAMLNMGVGGQNSYEGLGRLDGLRGLEADLVLVAFGANDCAYHYLVPEETGLALRSLALAVRGTHGADVALLGTAGDNPLQSGFQHLDETIEATRCAAAESESNFIDLRDHALSATQNGLNWADYFNGPTDCHPNDRGHELWAQTAFEALVAYWQL